MRSRPLDGFQKMLTIELTQGQVAFVDDVDSDLASHRWCAIKVGKLPFVVFYAKRRDGKKVISMHSIIARRAGIIGEVDHRNRNGTDNRRDNLRAATSSQNKANRRHVLDGAGHFRGIFRFGNRWSARLKVNGKSRHLGMFDTPEDAARARDATALEAFGKFAVLNFPKLGEET